MPQTLSLQAKSPYLLGWRGAGQRTGRKPDEHVQVAPQRVDPRDRWSPAHDIGAGVPPNAGEHISQSRFPLLYGGLRPQFFHQPLAMDGSAIQRQALHHCGHLARRHPDLHPIALDAEPAQDKDAKRRRRRVQLQAHPVSLMRASHRKSAPPPASGDLKENPNSARGTPSLACEAAPHHEDARLSAACVIGRNLCPEWAVSRLAGHEGSVNRLAATHADRFVSHASQGTSPAVRAVNCCGPRMA